MEKQKYTGLMIVQESLQQGLKMSPKCKTDLNSRILASLTLFSRKSDRFRCSIKSIINQRHYFNTEKDTKLN